MNFPQRRTLLITDAFKGIGYAIVERALSESLPYDIILTSTDAALGERAISTLRAKYPNSSSTFTYRQLDINNDRSIDALFYWVRKTHEKLNFLINNTDEEKRFLTKPNYLSLVKMTEKFLPLLSDDGKILEITSDLDGLQFQGDILGKLFECDAISCEKSSQTSNFKKVLGNVPRGSSFPGSKAFLNEYMKNLLPKKLKFAQRLYVARPDWVKVAFGSNTAPSSLAL